MAASLAFMLLALLVGIFRLMNDNGLVTGILSNLYTLHPIIMVFGFLAAIVMTERVAGLSVIPGLKKGSSSKVATAMVPLVFLGVLLEIAGYTQEIAEMKYLGVISLFASTAVFTYVLFALSKKTGIKLPFLFMILSVISLSAASILSGFELPLGQNGFIMLLLSFPIIFILGERVELTRFSSGKSSIRGFRLAFGTASLGVVLFALSSIPKELVDFQPYLISVGSALLFVTFLFVLFAEYQNFKLLAKSPLPLQKYVSIHTRAAYVWGMIGILLAELYFLRASPFDSYDAFIHSLAVGFVGTMLLAHGPVILPSITGRKIQTTHQFVFHPLILLTFGNSIRIAGDLVLQSLKLDLIMKEVVETAISFSGWLILAAVLLFLVRMMVSPINRGADFNGRTGTGVVSSSGEKESI
jgi:nitrite reductase (NO-forming)